ncbi:hypothetical protein DL96DRAFT_1709196 [Flagelloscypha sp. PMI_526]|nr:hypothetical protein DL96DRAFT_1709196 [Flagelloscypha sp. PMI_526]
MSRAQSFTLPIEIFSLIIEQLHERADYYTSALVSKEFNRAATPLLYRSLDSNISSKHLTAAMQPSRTLLSRPEKGALYCGSDPQLLNDTLKALSFCKGLACLTWIETAGENTSSILLRFLDVVRELPVIEINLRTHNDLDENVWSQLVQLSGLRKISVWSMQGPPSILKDWTPHLGTTLQRLELGVGTFCYPCTELIAQLPHLQDLRLKGASALAIPTIVSFLPDLQSLDAEFIQGVQYLRSRQSGSPQTPPSSGNHPRLTSLTVRTSMDALLFSQALWTWIKDLVPRPGLEALKICTYRMSMSHPIVPRMFLLEMILLHGDSLKHLALDNALLTLDDIECVCSNFTVLESLECAICLEDFLSFVGAMKNARTLRKLHLNFYRDPSLQASAWEHMERFNLEQAWCMMTVLPQLRVIVVESIHYEGKWVLDKEGKLQFVVIQNAEGDWHI